MFTFKFAYKHDFTENRTVIFKYLDKAARKLYYYNMNSIKNKNNIPSAISMF